MLGIDLVYLPEFEEKFKSIPLDKAFSAQEISENKSRENLAGVFAAKEAFFKAIGKKENWLDVWIEKNKEGQPMLKSALIKNDRKIELSISHGGNYALAIVIIV